MTTSFIPTDFKVAYKFFMLTYIIEKTGAYFFNLFIVAKIIQIVFAIFNYIVNSYLLFVRGLF